MDQQAAAAERNASLLSYLSPTKPVAWLRGWSLRKAREFFFSLLEKVNLGEVTVITCDGRKHAFGSTKQCDLRATLTLRNELSFYWRVFTLWDVGFGEAFMYGDIEVDNLTEFVLLMIKNRNLSDQGTAFAWLGASLARLEHLSRSNTVSNSKKNIHAHYDLSNEMFKSFLDPSMMYSCGLFLSKNDTLEQAQKTKIHKILRQAQVTASDHVLEIGSGWGGFAIEAAKRTGCRVTTITISEEQFTEAKQRIQNEGLQDRIDIRLCDYRKITGKYDKIISIEMVEAVGHEYFGEYFKTIDNLLADNGLVLIQAITYPDSRYEQYRKGCDFIQKHIFPGGICPSISALCEAMRKHSQLQLEALDNFGGDYAETLRRWRANFLASSDRLKALGFPPEFLRKWLYYFCYCEAGFESRVLGTVHILLTRPGNSKLAGQAGLAG